MGKEKLGKESIDERLLYCKMNVIQRLGGFEQSIPVNASNATKVVEELKEEFLTQPYFSYQFVVGASFGQKDGDFSSSKSARIQLTEDNLTTAAFRFNCALNDIRHHLRVLMISGIEKGNDIHGLQGFSDDIDAIQKRLLKINSKIGEYNLNYIQKPGIDDRIRNIYIQEYRTWLIKEINDFYGHVEIVSRMYKMIA